MNKNCVHCVCNKSFGLVPFGTVDNRNYAVTKNVLPTHRVKYFMAEMMTSSSHLLLHSTQLHINKYDSCERNKNVYGTGPAVGADKVDELRGGHRDKFYRCV